MTAAAVMAAVLCISHKEMRLYYIRFEIIYYFRPTVEFTIDKSEAVCYYNKKPTNGREWVMNMTKGERTRKKLLDIAYELFLSKGYEETSVEDILSRAQIAKGTYYYYFESKEQMLEEVIDMMIEEEAQTAQKILESGMPAPQKIIGIIAAFHPSKDEQPIGDLLNRPENLLMHKKVMTKLMNKLIPMLGSIVEDGVNDGVFSCRLISVRVKVLLIVASALFDDNNQTPEEIEVFIDLTEKILGAEKGTMDFMKTLIGQSDTNKLREGEL